MAGPWEEYQAPDAAVAERLPWEDYGAPPAPAPAPRAAAPVPATGAIPGQEGELARRATARAAQREPTFAEKLSGAVETAIDAAAPMIGMIPGAWGGLLGAGAGAVQTALERRAQPPSGNPLEEGVARGSTMARSALREMFGFEPNAPSSETSQGFTSRYVQPVAENLPAVIAGPRGTLGMAGEGPNVLKSPEANIAAAALRSEADLAGTAIGKVTGPLADSLRPELSPRNLQRTLTANKADIPVSPHQLVGNKFLQMLGETAESVPMAGGQALRATRKGKLSGALARQIDETSQAKVLDDTTFRGLQDTAGKAIGEIMGRTDVPAQSIGDLVSQAARDSDPAVRDVISRFNDDVKEAAEANDGIIPGPTLRELRTRAAGNERELAGGTKSDLANAWGRVVKVLDDATTENAAEGDAAALFKNRKSYAISKVLEPLVAKHPDGNFPVSSLYSIVTSTKAGKHRMARGEAGDIGDYAELGRETLRELASSNTAERQLIYDITRGELSEKPGAFMSSVLWAGAGLYNLLGPRIVRRMAESQARRQAPPSFPVEPPTLEAGFEGVPQNPSPGARPAGDLSLTPDWETAPGSTAQQNLEVAPAEGLVAPVGETQPLRPTGGFDPRPRRTVTDVGPVQPGPSRPAPARGAIPEEIPAVPGRPDLPDTLVVGEPGEAAGAARRGVTGGGTGEAVEPVTNVEATGAAMQAPEAVLARQQQAVGALREQTASPEVQKVLDEHAAKLEREAKRRATAAEMHRVAGLTTDPAIRQALFDRAAKLETAEKVPTGKATEGSPAEKTTPTRKIPTGQATEVPVETIEPESPIPTGEATEITPETVEAPNAPDQVQQQGGVQPERGGGNEGGQAAAAGSGHRVQRQAEGGRQAAETKHPEGLKPGQIYTDANGKRAIYQADGTWKEIE